jgi:hypothetical protein
MTFQGMKISEDSITIGGGDDAGGANLGKAACADDEAGAAGGHGNAIAVVVSNDGDEPATSSSSSSSTCCGSRIPPGRKNALTKKESFSFPLSPPWPFMFVSMINVVDIAFAWLHKECVTVVKDAKSQKMKLLSAHEGKFGVPQQLLKSSFEV